MNLSYIEVKEQMTNYLIRAVEDNGTNSPTYLNLGIVCINDYVSRLDAKSYAFSFAHEVALSYHARVISG